MELVSLTGWIAPRVDGGAEIHAHFAASTVQNETVVTLGGHLTEGTICGIKVVVAILVLDDGSLYAIRTRGPKPPIFFSTPSPMCRGVIALGGTLSTRKG